MLVYGNDGRSKKSYLIQLCVLACSRLDYIMSATRGTDAVRVLRGVQIVLDEVIKAGEQNCKRTMKNCSIVTSVKDATVQFADRAGAAKLKVIFYSILHYIT